MKSINIEKLCKLLYNIFNSYCYNKLERGMSNGLPGRIEPD